MLKSQSTSTNKTNLKVLGDSPLELVITGIRQLTPHIRGFEFRNPNGNELPGFEAGAHLVVPVLLADGELSSRHYSICSDPARKDVYECTILLDENGKGGSSAVHELFNLGLRLRCGLPQNNFRLHTDARPIILIAGGIGITPIKAMAHTLQSQKRDFHIHYAVCNTREAAYLDQLSQEFSDQLTVYESEQNRRMNLDELLTSSPSDAVFYICGPNRLIDAVTASAQAQGFDPDRIRLERFSALTGEADRPFEVKAISCEEYTRIAQDFSSFSRRKNRRVASYVTIFTTQKMDKKTSKLGIFFAGNRLSYGVPTK